MRSATRTSAFNCCKQYGVRTWHILVINSSLVNWPVVRLATDVVMLRTRLLLELFSLGNALSWVAIGLMMRYQLSLERERARERDRDRDRDTYRDTERDRERETERDRERQRERQRETERETE